MITTQDYSKKIPAYLDGMMNDNERLDFESFVGSNAEFAKLFRQKQFEQESLRKRVPEVTLDAETQQSLELEARETIANLFKDDDAPPTSRISNWLKELF